MNENSISHSLSVIFSKINEISLQNPGISGHTIDYIRAYSDSKNYYISVYTRLMMKALSKLKKPVNQCTFVDYGGGCGIMSFAAKETGFRTVIYNDIYERSVADARIISSSLDKPVDLFICGDIKELIEKTGHYGIDIDLICSFDVLEHIYNLESWLTSLSELKHFSLVFMTTANPRNPLIAQRLKRIHMISEYQGCEKNIRINDEFINTSFLKERQIIIAERFPALKSQMVATLALKTRGLRIDGIEKVVDENLRTGEIKYIMNHPTNTCDPYTGSWAEKLIDLKELKSLIEKVNMKGRITNSFYCYSRKKILNAMKFIANSFIRISGRECLMLSPAIILEIDKY